MLKIPYGIIDYRKLKEEGYYYVDKTMYLDKLENVSSTNIYLKPGRFGKSLFTSMMYYYYDINSESLFNTLFKDTYVYENPTKNKNNYYVLKFDFSNITTRGMTEKELLRVFNNKVIAGIEDFILYYDLDYKIEEKEITPSEILNKFFVYFKGLKLNHKIYVLVDEYDNFTNGILEGDTTLFENVVTKNGFVKSFYAAIKEYVMNGVVDRFYATGICPVTLNSMTTGFNIALDLSTDYAFNSMIGLTHEEIRKILKDLELTKEEQENLYNLMIEHYDGYLFSSLLKEENRVFNATLVMYLLNYYQRAKILPESLYDNNIVINYDKIENLLKLQENKYYKEIIEKILDDGEITATLTTQFNLLERFKRDDIISLLYYFGYLTIKQADITGALIFKVPNKAMKVTYGNYFLKLLRDIDITMDSQKVREGLVEIIEEGEIRKLTNYIEEVLKELGSRMLIEFSEKYIQELYFAILMNYDAINIYTEYPVRNGYCDVYINSRNAKLKNNIIIELKYIKKKEYSKKILENKKEEAKKQIEEYSKDERINNNLRKYIVIFVGNEVKMLEEIE